MYAFFKNKIVPLADAKVSVMTHALHYGTAVFEGIRGNWNPDEQQVYIFKLREHMTRLQQGSKVMHIKLRYSPDELSEIAAELVRKSGLKEDLYIRPLAYKSEEVVANLKANTLADDFLMVVVKFGNYLDPSLAIHCCTSTWRRTDDMSIPPRVKASGAYLNNILAKTEAVENGFDEAIILNHNGHVSEGSGENIFLVQNGKLVTPAKSDNILEGITRNTIIEVAQEELGIPTEERSVDRSELYLSDEVFLTGTAAHLTPVGMVDRRAVGDGQIGPVTRKLQALFFDIIRGKNKRYIRWCTPAYVPVKAEA